MHQTFLKTRLTSKCKRNKQSSAHRSVKTSAQPQAVPFGQNSNQGTSKIQEQSQISAPAPEGMSNANASSFLEIDDSSFQVDISSQVVSSSQLDTSQSNSSAHTAKTRLERLQENKPQKSRARPATILNGAKSAKERLKRLKSAVKDSGEANIEHLNLKASQATEHNIGVQVSASGSCATDITNNNTATTTTTTAPANATNATTTSSTTANSASATNNKIELLDTQLTSSEAVLTTSNPRGVVPEQEQFSAEPESLADTLNADKDAYAHDAQEVFESKAETAISSATDTSAETPLITKPETKATTGVEGEAAVECDLEQAVKSNQESESKPNFYPVVVYTPQELEEAQKSGAERILVKGQLASKLETALKGLRSMSAASLNTLALVISGAALLSPFTGGVSLGAAGTVMGTLGAAVTAAAIAAISAIGLSLVIAVLKGYDEVKIGGGGLELVIKKNKDKNPDKAEVSGEQGNTDQDKATKDKADSHSQATGHDLGGQDTADKNLEAEHSEQAKQNKS